MRLDSPIPPRPNLVGAVREPPSELLLFTVGLDSPELAERSNAAEANSGPRGDHWTSAARRCRTRVINC